MFSTDGKAFRTRTDLSRTSTIRVAATDLASGNTVKRAPASLAEQSSKMLAMTMPDLYAFLSQCRLGVLSTIGGGNVPQSALVRITVTENLEIVFDTVNSSRKFPNLIAQSTCSFVIDWAAEKTVQYEGLAYDLSGDELPIFQQNYLNAWPECREHLGWPDIAYFVVLPRWISYSDFEKKPPLIREFTFELSAEGDAKLGNEGSLKEIPSHGHV